MRRKRLLMLCCLGWVGVLTNTAQATAQCAPKVGRQDFYVGGRTDDPVQGIVAATLETKTGDLAVRESVASIVRPTWMVIDRRQQLLFSVSEVGNSGARHGSVSSFLIDCSTGKLKLRTTVDSGGSGPTNLTYDRMGGTLFVANFGGGEVTTIPVEEDGVLGDVVSTQKDFGTGPSPRQRGPHAHSVVIDPSRKFVLVPDFGADRVFIYKYHNTTHTIEPNSTPYVSVPSGSGPRRLAFSPDGKLAFLLTELSAEIIGYRWDPDGGTLTKVSSVSLDDENFTGKKSAAELAISRKGNLIYVANRGENLLQVYSFENNTGKLTQIQKLNSGGLVPWGFSFDRTGQWLLVANEASNGVASFHVDPASGRLVPKSGNLTALKPAAIVFQ